MTQGVRTIGLVPRLRRSDPLQGVDSQPFRAGLTFGGRPSGPCIYDHVCSVSLNLPQASQLLGTTKGTVERAYLRLGTRDSMSLYRRIPGLECETWGTLRFLPTMRLAGSSTAGSGRIPGLKCETWGALRFLPTVRLTRSSTAGRRFRLGRIRCAHRSCLDRSGRRSAGYHPWPVPTWSRCG